MTSPSAAPELRDALRRLKEAHELLTHVATEKSQPGTATSSSRNTYDPDVAERASQAAQLISVAMTALSQPQTEAAAPPEAASRTKSPATVIATRIPTIANASQIDDLTAIRGIDAACARRLSAIGITRFSQIAAWGPDDVRAIASALDLGKAMSQQNWIEQAHLLASKGTGGPTDGVVDGVVVAPDTRREALRPSHLPTRQPAPEPTHDPEQALVLVPVPTVHGPASDTMLDDILATIRAETTSRQTAKRISEAQNTPRRSSASGSLTPTAATGATAKPRQLTAQVQKPLLTEAATRTGTLESATEPQRRIERSVTLPTYEPATTVGLPVHKMATQRIEQLEAELTSIGNTLSTARHAENSRRNAMPSLRKSLISNLWRARAPDARDEVRNAGGSLPAPEVGEAEVEIVPPRTSDNLATAEVTTSRQAMNQKRLNDGPALQVDEAPLQVAHTATAAPPPAPDEASVVIVKKPSQRELPARSAPTAPSAVDTGVRRLFRTLIGG
jgi:predicted flap endonuclease-1-like 5' DNA nuclease